jgi:hypothetical protein
VHTYVNGKMRPVEPIAGMGEGGGKGEWWGGECSYDILDIL